ncbi:hypothetical protein BX600DRAFT_442091 [Xylariales sp. PMI_506]|nr:hypothetical protein BX600DRAFT_442091 [Xylariales sp. PMI_506]
MSLAAPYSDRHSSPVPARAGHLSKNQYLEYLSGLARELPDCRVCGDCASLHLVLPHDYAMSGPIGDCPRARFNSSSKHFCLEGIRFDPRVTSLPHRHIQLALKYTSLELQGSNDHLSLLLKPRGPWPIHRIFDPRTSPIRVPRPDVVDAEYWCIPKIVASGAGNGQHRYLLMSVWRYRKAKAPVTLETIGLVRACPHLHWDIRDNPLLYANRTDVLAKCMMDSFVRDGPKTEACGSCSRCAADIAVRASYKIMELRTWQDLGTEGSPMALEWRSHLTDTSSTETHNVRSDGLAVPHKPGSVRAMYETSPVRDLRPWSKLKGELFYAEDSPFENQGIRWRY